MKKLAALISIGVLAGCGGQQIAPISLNVTSLAAQSTSGLRAAWDGIHKAVFTRTDSNKDGNIDEYEAGNTISLNDYAKADLNLDGNIQYTEFMKYATKGGFLQKDDSLDAFVDRMRKDLGKINGRLDANRDGLLDKTEVSTKALTKVGFAFYYDSLKIKLALANVTDEQFDAADKTKDAKLGPAEFEDLYVTLVLAGLTPAPATK